MIDNINDNWYENFFYGMNCELWLKAVPESFTKQEVDFLFRELNIKAGERLLDVPCGYGRHSLEFARKGINVTGIDISPTFIEILEQQLKEEELPVTAVCADFLSSPLQTRFNAAICMGNSFGYFDYERMKIFVQKISDALVKDSKFVINTGMLAESILPNFTAQKAHVIEDITMNIRNSYNVREGFMRSDILYRKNSNEETYSFKHYVFTLAEVTRLLSSCGFKVTSVFSSTTRSQFKFGDPQAYIVAVKM